MANCFLNCCLTRTFVPLGAKTMSVFSLNCRYISHPLNSLFKWPRIIGRSCSRHHFCEALLLKLEFCMKFFGSFCGLRVTLFLPKQNVEIHRPQREAAHQCEVRKIGKLFKNSYNAQNATKIWPNKIGKICTSCEPMKLKMTLLWVEILEQLWLTFAFSHLLAVYWKIQIVIVTTQLDSSFCKRPPVSNIDQFSCIHQNEVKLPPK